jgi:uncharacterized protein YjiS (DUF1127 family)
MEMSMSTTFSAPAAAHGIPDKFAGGGVIAVMKRWWLAQLARRFEREAIIRLHAMSDRELKDIGLSRSQIAHAVRGEPGDHAFGYY